MTAPNVLSQYQAYQRCTLEGHPSAEWLRRMYGNGSLHIEFYCLDCDRPVTAERYGTRGHAVSAEWFAEHITSQCSVTPDELRIHRGALRLQLCYLCRKTAPCEYHHVAPQAIYGKDADKYPVVPLCKVCHDTETKDFSRRLRDYVTKNSRIPTGIPRIPSEVGD